MLFKGNLLSIPESYCQAITARYRPRFFDQVRHQTTYASMENKHFFTKQCHPQTYQNYEQNRQKLGTFSENKVRSLKIKVFKKFQI